MKNLQCRSLTLSTYYEPGTDAGRVDWKLVSVDVVHLLEYVVHIPHLHRAID